MGPAGSRGLKGPLPDTLALSCPPVDAAQAHPFLPLLRQQPDRFLPARPHGLRRPRAAAAPTASSPYSSSPSAAAASSPYSSSAAASSPSSSSAAASSRPGGDPQRHGALAAAAAPRRRGGAAGAVAPAAGGVPLLVRARGVHPAGRGRRGVRARRAGRRAAGARRRGLPVPRPRTPLRRLRGRGVRGLRPPLAGLRRRRLARLRLQEDGHVRHPQVPLRRPGPRLADPLPEGVRRQDAGHVPCSRPRFSVSTCCASVQQLV
jgi:hypothetical protein